MESTTIDNFADFELINKIIILCGRFMIDRAANITMK